MLEIQASEAKTHLPQLLVKPKSLTEWLGSGKGTVTFAANK